MHSSIPHTNNFDLIRLLAACQVVYMHSLKHLKINGLLSEFFDKFLQYFPGVPIFFTVSGFLIFWAYDRNQNIKKYSINRILRLYPALYVCLFITIFLLIFFSSFSLLVHSSFYLWLIGQLTVLQFYTPELLKFWGVGTPNGALWTITVEVQFYILVPIIFFLMKRLKGAVVLFLLCVLSLMANFYFGSLNENIIKKISIVSIIPHLFNFLIGSSFYIFWTKLSKFIENKFIVWFTIYVVYFLIFGVYLGKEIHAYEMTNIFQVITTVLLSLVTLSLAFSHKNLSNNLLKHNDISYGLYIYHMLVINTLVAISFLHEPLYIPLTFIVTIILATLSWKLIEKPALSLKNRF
ncbi:acyltransferase [Acinetobacter oleivorans]|uniref:acyltransferase family protein n=1 Tax=Acinetobacter oleivorans TaxID=1148157 RepID=UPI000D31A1FC|nr:acyltransferase [Acinetobacter oleivorans]PTV44523.1 acyltransferase [Acinetobacter oleivorans]